MSLSEEERLKSDLNDMIGLAGGEKNRTVGA